VCGYLVSALDIQPEDGGISQQICDPNTDGANLLDSDKAIYVINNFTYAGSPYTFQSSYNTTYSDALSQLGPLNVISVSLILDSG
jgi:hypothetical protein